MATSYHMVVACTTDGGIGKDGGIPWRLPEDLRRFRAITEGGCVIMGRKTWESLPRRPLAGRQNVVVGLGMDAASLEEALALVEDGRSAFVIGGARLYTEAMADPRCVNVYVTIVDGNFDCDVHIDVAKMRQSFPLCVRKDIGDGCTFCEWRRAI